MENLRSSGIECESRPGCGSRNGCAVCVLPRVVVRRAAAYRSSALHIRGAHPTIRTLFAEVHPVQTSSPRPKEPRTFNWLGGLGAEGLHRGTVVVAEPDRGAAPTRGA